MDSPFQSEVSIDVAWWNRGEDQTVVWSDTTVPLAHDYDAGLGGPNTVRIRELADVSQAQRIDWDSAVAFESLPYACPDLEDPTFIYSQDNNCMNFGLIPPGLTPATSSTDGDSIASSQSDVAWAAYIPLPTQPVGEPHIHYVPSTSAAPPAQYPAWFETPGQFNNPTASSFVDDSNAMRSIDSYPEFNSTAGFMPWGSAEFSPAHVSPGEELLPVSILGKLPCKDDETSGDRLGQCKKKTATDVVLDVAGSLSRAREKPVTRTTVRDENASEAVGRGAGRLAAPNAQGVHHQLQPGLSAQGELTGTTAQGQLQLVEGSERGVNYASSAVQQPEAANSIQDKKQEEEAEDAKLIRLPRGLTQRHQALLKATSADWERGSIHERKCRLCPDPAFCNWNVFKRHCNDKEAHPLKIAFCEHCGDFFARGDSLARHRRNRPPECLGVVSLAEAEAKRKETEEAHREFEKKLQRYLESGEAIGTPFAQAIKEKFPKSSKRGSRQQSRIKGSWSRS